MRAAQLERRELELESLGLEDESTGAISKADQEITGLDISKVLANSEGEGGEENGSHWMD